MPLPLKKAEIIGQRVNTVYEISFPVKRRFQDREVIVRLESGVCFSFDPLKNIEVEIDRNVVIVPCDLKEACVPVLSINANEHLKSPIKAIVYSDYFEHEVGVLLENNYVLMQYIAEFQTGAWFDEPDEKTLKSCIELTIADNKSY